MEAQVAGRPEEIKGLPWVNAITKEADNAGNTTYRVFLENPIDLSIIGLIRWLITKGLGWAGGSGAKEMLVWCEGQDTGGEILLELTNLLRPGRTHPLAYLEDTDPPNNPT